MADDLGEGRFAPGDRSDVLCIGSPLMDQLAFAPLEALAPLGLVHGTMTLVDITTTERLADLVPPAKEVSGGTVANTASGIASFGGRAGLLGVVADDALGTRYATDLLNAGVDAHLVCHPADASSEASTGRCFVVITPDSQRTMATALGVSGQLRAAAVAPQLVAAARLCYFDGYVLDFPDAADLVDAVLEAAGRGGTTVAFGLADPFVVERHFDAVSDLVRRVDLLFSNEDEILALTGAATPSAALAGLARPDLLAVATLGPAGAVARLGGEELAIPARAVSEVVDVTGAGDLFASGVLFGRATGRDLRACVELGALAASEVIGHLGARPAASLLDLAGNAGLV